ncbi:MAG: fused MFS/spermidine synthase [Anaerolineae bacterium]
MTSSSFSVEPTGAGAHQESTAADLFAGRPWLPVLIVFVSNTCMMVLELVAGRIIAPYVGVSLYTWTSVIGVVLAGMSLGNYLGGRLADRWASARLLGGVFLLAGLFSAAILTADTLGLQLPDAWPIVLRILAFTSALFFIPSMVLGGVSPIVVKLAVRDLAKTGSTVGRISAAGTVGSIVGTFATGFVLISAFGTHVIVWGVAIVLLLMAAFLLLRDAGPLRPFVAGVAVLVIGGGTPLAAAQGWIASRCQLETNYFCIKVHEEERNGDKVRILILDRLVHSYSSLTDPTKLVYGYEQVYAEATAYQARRHNPLKALFIGGGGYTFPRYMEALYPGSRLDVIEIDPGVTQVAYDLLGLARDTTVVTYNEDARMYLKRPPTVQYDLIMGDAFNDYSVPYHLTTREFNEQVAAWLADDGLYMVNMIDGPRRDFLRAYINTLQQTFSAVYVIPAVRSWRASPRVTFVIIAGNRPLDLAVLQTIDAGDGDPMLAQMLLDPAEVEAILSERQPVTLTDRYAPVDQMLAPVFRGEEKPD